jgi:hypothetical protein
MTSIRLGVLILATIAFGSAILLAIVFIHMKVSDTAWVSGMGAVVAITALANSVLVFALSDERARFSNAFEIASQWDKEPMLGAREIIRPHLANFESLKQMVATDTEINSAVVHLVNFYWNMASAIEVRWAQAGYLRLRFRASLNTFLPLMEEWERKSSDRSGSEAIASITRLNDLWAGRPA